MTSTNGISMGTNNSNYIYKSLNHARCVELDRFPNIFFSLIFFHDVIASFLMSSPSSPLGFVILKILP